MDLGLPGSSVHGVFQVRILEWVAISLSRESRDWAQVPCIGRWILYCWATWEAQERSEKIYLLQFFFFFQVPVEIAKLTGISTGLGLEDRIEPEI